MSAPKRIAIIGAGAIGSSFAFSLARGGHDVSVIARGKRLEQLSLDRAIVTVGGERAPVTPLPSLPVGEAFDLVIVSVLPTQVDAVLPQLLANPSPVMFMFNAFDGHSALRERIGRERFAWGFPATVVALVDGRILVKSSPKSLQLLQITTFGGLRDHQPGWLPPWRDVFVDCGIPTAVERDMVAWLRTHVAFILPLMVGGLVVLARRAGLTWADSTVLARGARACFQLVRALGHPITPAKLGLLGFAPLPLMTLTFFVLSRTRLARSAVTGIAEARLLLEELLRLSPSPAPALTEMAVLLNQAEAKP